MVVNKAGHMVGWQTGCDPTLKAPVAKKKEENKGKQANLSTLPGQENAREEGTRDCPTHASECGQIKAHRDAAHEGQKDGDQGPGIDLWRIAGVHQARCYVKVIDRDFEQLIW
jgi:hypothetical protein